MRKVALLIIVFACFSSFDGCIGKVYAEKSPQQIIDSTLIVLKKQKEDTNKVNTYNFLCWKFSDSGENSKVIFYAQKGIELANKLHYKKGLKVTYNELGIVNINQGNFTQAINYLTKSVNIAQQINDLTSASKSLVNIGNVYNYQSNYPKALQYYNWALPIFEKLNDGKSCANIYNNIGTIMMDQKNDMKALNYFQKSLNIRIKIKDKYGESDCYCNIGAVYEKQLKYTEALRVYEKALAIKEKLEDKKGCVFLMMNISKLYQNAAELNKAIELLKKGEILAQEIGDKPQWSKMLINQSWNYSKLKKYNIAKLKASKALQLSKEIGELESLRFAYQALGESEVGLGNFKAAYECHVLFKQLTDSIFNEENSKQLSDIKTKYEVDKKESELNAANKIEQAKKDAQIKQQKLLRNSFIGGFILILIIAIGVFRSLQQNRKAKAIITKQKEEVEQQKEIVEHQKKEVEEKNHEILQSITYAQRLQDAILPPIRIVKEYLKESFILYKPKDIVAGDFYWMHSVQFDDESMSKFDNEKNTNNKHQLIDKLSNRQILFAAADCTGHGVPGAMVSVVCSNALNRAVKEFGLTTPGLILDKVRELVVETFEKSESQIKDGMDISLCSVNVNTLELEWAGANNPLWIIRNETKELESIKPDKQPIGHSDNPTPFTTHTIQLKEGDCFYIFTDGFQDQFGGEKGKKFMAANMREMFLSIHTKPMDEQKKIINTTIENWRGNLEQVDDICVIGVRV